jgi:hypothetical protein
LDDLSEAMAGILGTSDPVSADTDADALPDGLDPYPLHPVNRLTLSGPITIDGLIGADEGWRLFNNRPWQLISTEPFSAAFILPGTMTISTWAFTSATLPTFASISMQTTTVGSTDQITMR